MTETMIAVDVNPNDLIDLGHFVQPRPMGGHLPIATVSMTPPKCQTERFESYLDHVVAPVVVIVESLQKERDIAGYSEAFYPNLLFENSFHYHRGSFPIGCEKGEGSSWKLPSLGNSPGLLGMGAAWVVVSSP